MTTSATDSVSISPSRLRTQTKLLDAAYEVFARHGVGNVTVDTIADHAGFTRGAFYSNFATKNDLLAALAIRECSRRMNQVHAGRQIVEQFDWSDISGPISTEIHRDIARRVVDAFVNLQQEPESWLVIEQEIRLLAMRDPKFGAVLLEHENALIAELEVVITEVVHSSGLQFVLAPNRAVNAIVSLYIESKVQSTMGADADQSELLEALTDVCVAFTTPVNAAVEP